MTSAPCWASSIAQYGPAMPWLRSTTRMPASGVSGLDMSRDPTRDSPESRGPDPPRAVGRREAPGSGRCGLAPGSGPRISWRGALTWPAAGGSVALTVARFLLRHLAFLLLTLLVVSFLVFTLNELSPGAAARKILGAYATQEQVDLLTRQMGLDRPLLVRYAEYVGKLASGDLGESTRFKVPVKDIIWSRLANTVFLAAIAFACIVPMSMLLGVAAGMRESSALDRAILLFSTVVASVPEFALGVFLASIFVVGLGWLPGTATLVAGGGWSVASES